MRCARCQKKRADFAIPVRNMIIMCCVGCLYEAEKRWPEECKRSHVVNGEGTGLMFHKVAKK